ncbi:diguanylate cyclase [Faunimonas sp. B44]|uniref:diguanylate cyclase n=1 Tax=Faunimonas sp. B44 TaxID=3461493 RepID=UPI004044E80F
MRIDETTMMVAGSFTAALTGALLIYAWFQFRDGAGALWWAFGNLSLALGIALLASHWTERSALVGLLAFFFLTLSPALAWAAARRFNDRRINWAVVTAGPLLWLIVWTAFPVHDSPSGMITFNIAATAVYMALTAWELGRPAGERLRSSRALLIFVLLHFAYMSACLVEVPAGQLSGPPPVGSIFGLIHFETFVYTVATSLFVLAMVRERSEAEHRNASLIDPLTGVPNRRSFIGRAEPIFARAVHARSPVSALMLDLDRFKAVNDTFGHDLGDRVLQTLADVAQKTLRPHDVLARWGGEEFVVILPETEIEVARAVAERLRLAFMESAREIAGAAVGATISVGIATDGGAEGDLHALLKRADAALYRAKRLGRNRVEAELHAPSGPDTTTARIA